MLLRIPAMPAPITTTRGSPIRSSLAGAARRLGIRDTGPVGEVLGERAILRAVELTLCAFDGVGPVSLVIGDVDGPRGERVLSAVGDRLLAQAREDDLVGRYGDSFVVVLPDTGPAEARAWAELARVAVHEACVPGRARPA